MKSKDKKQQIIDAAIEVISNQGIEKTSVREIAAAAGLTTGAIYYHYKNKEELFQDVVNESIHFSHKISEKYTNKSIPQENLLNIIVSEVSKRLEKDNEQKLHIALMSDIISKKDAINQQYIDNYKQIIKNTGDLFAPAFGIENNEEYKYLISSILIAAL
uniref:TetR/AcrR family transcriptional regulator n=1 Tax=Lacrimispora sp. TaxID=2719234 RepID=UPI0028AD380C